MRGRLESALPNVRALAGFAESIPLPNASVDGVAVGQAFHWFRPEAVTEIARVLRPGRGLALIWNTRDDADPVQAAITRLIEPLRHGEPDQKRRLWRRLLTGSDVFGELEERSFPFEQELDRAGLLDRVASISFVAVAPPAERERVLTAVRELAASLPAPIRLAHRTDAFVCFRR
jgi:SAM-dependent methyltransferase